MKRALLIGIDRYDNVNPLRGCVNDVNALKPLLAENEDGTPNFDCQLRTTAIGVVSRRTMLESIDALLAPGADVALLYFAGHGAQELNDVVLVSEDGVPADFGVPLATVLGKAESSSVPEIVIILDCCFAGGAGGVPQLGGEGAFLRPGLSILAASRGDQTSAETSSARGLFSTYLCGALDGGAADVLGKVTVAGLYAYLSESFGPWDQRPTFKANVDRLHVLRLCSPAVPVAELRRLPEFFPDVDDLLPLDPSYEPDAAPEHPEHEAIFAVLQRCRAAKLVEPVGTDHMYFAAIESRSCRLTPLGKHYWRMAARQRI